MCKHIRKNFLSSFYHLPVQSEEKKSTCYVFVKVVKLENKPGGWKDVEISGRKERKSNVCESKAIG